MAWLEQKEELQLLPGQTANGMLDKLTSKVRAPVVGLLAQCDNGAARWLSEKLSETSANAWEAELQAWSNDDVRWPQPCRRCTLEYNTEAHHNVEHPSGNAAIAVASEYGLLHPKRHCEYPSLQRPPMTLRRTRARGQAQGRQDMATVKKHYLVPPKAWSRLMELGVLAHHVRAPKLAALVQHTLAQMLRGRERREVVESAAVEDTRTRREAAELAEAWLRAPAQEQAPRSEDSAEEGTHTVQARLRTLGLGVAALLDSEYDRVTLALLLSEMHVRAASNHSVLAALTSPCKQTVGAQLWVVLTLVRRALISVLALSNVATDNWRLMACRNPLHSCLIRKKKRGSTTWA